MGSGASYIGLLGKSQSGILIDPNVSTEQLNMEAEIFILIENIKSLETVPNWILSHVMLNDGKVIVKNPEKTEILLEILLDRKSDIKTNKLEDGLLHIVICQDDIILSLKSQNDEEFHRWLKAIREEMMICRKSLDTVFDQFREILESEIILPDQHCPSEIYQTIVSPTIIPPALNIVILVVGTRGDVQPFIYLGQELRRRGHRVRVATHAEYRHDVTTHGGLEYYPLAGDPRKLSEYMVKSGGRLLPDLLREEERQILPEKMKMLREICFSCFPACTAPDPEDLLLRPFVADAIISNPVAGGHFHCAEALSVPLHIMFPQPWYPTRSFPHPLSNRNFKKLSSNSNYSSYKLVDEYMWMGLGYMANDFRRDVLGLPVIRYGEGGDSLLNDNKVPIAHMWSPAFVPKCSDWPPHVDVVGEFRLMDTQNLSYMPAASLADFLSKGDKPVYIGFGSMMIEDVTSLLMIIKEAVARVGCRVLLQSGWTKYAEDYEYIADNIMVIGAMSHDWLFQQVSAVIHHGGAGTTSAGLRAGNPTFICPFFGDQHFWAEMVSRAGTGPPGCPIKELTVEKLVHALEMLRADDTSAKAKALGALMSSEDGVTNGVDCFHRNLPLASMICEVSIFNSRQSKLARVFCSTCGLKMCFEIDRVIHRDGGGRENHLRAPFRSVRWGMVKPTNIMQGIGQGVRVAVYELAGGLWDLFAKPVEGALEGGVIGAATGFGVGVAKLIARPLIGGGILLERVVVGAMRRTPEHVIPDGALNTRPPEFTSPEPIMVDETNLKKLRREGLPEEVLVIENAFRRARKFLKCWLKIDKSGDRVVDLKELTAHMSPEDAVALLESADANNDGTLTFSELAWNMCSTNNSRNKERRPSIFEILKITNGAI